eukprot:Gregarina_sp_Pseudo_9__4055@NODE_4197_length_468_cov_163_200466_g3868_i0_p1_GENE_NODE_4197_length_468_cov_163_200466_g3868_i0NODE_4197_length_468_cov_163_200466_g3868_i0_p1_ORF_typecomplete_len131_score7_84UMP1/PF05348_11/5_9e10_NODE_4197_length_468_cov_163_200466_g3868_i07399
MASHQFPTLDTSIRPTFETGLGQKDINAENPVAVVEDIVSKGPHRDEIAKLNALGFIYGQHAPHTFFTERQLVSHQRRLPGSGLPSSMLSLELLMGTEDRVPFDEFAYIPKVSCPSDRLGVHYMCEKNLQ